MTLVAPRIVNDVSNVRRINHESDFSWQAQYLVKLECHFSWQGQHFVQFWEIAGARNVAFFHTKCVPRWVEKGLRSGGCEMTILSIMVGSCSDHPRIIYPRIVFILAEAIQGLAGEILNAKFRGRRSIW